MNRPFRLATLAVAAAFAALPALPALAQERIDGVVQKIDPAAKKLTLKHGEIKSLDMPPMTMVYQVRDPGLLDKVKPGDKVKFSVAKTGGQLIVTTIEPAP